MEAPGATAGADTGWGCSREELLPRLSVPRGASLAKSRPLCSEHACIPKCRHQQGGACVGVEARARACVRVCVRALQNGAVVRGAVVRAVVRGGSFGEWDKNKGIDVLGSTQAHA